MGQRLISHLILALVLLCVIGCPQQEGDQGAASACNESDLIGQCPAGSDPLFGSAASEACGGISGIDLVDGTGSVSGRCLGTARCIVACQFAAPCPCGVTAITRDGVFCTSCNQAAACGNGICEGGENPEQCPEDCGRQCNPGEMRCVGDTAMEVCDLRGRFESLECPQGEICQGVDGVVICRRDDVLVGVDPDADPNVDPEASERFERDVITLPDGGDVATAHGGLELAWSAGFEVAIGQYNTTMAFDAMGGLWLWQADGAKRLDPDTGEVLQLLDVPDGELDPWALAVAGGNTALFVKPERTALVSEVPLHVYRDGGFTTLGTTGAYKYLGGGHTSRVAALSADGEKAAAILRNAFQYAPDPRYPNDMRLVVLEYALWLADTDGTWVGAIAGEPGNAHDIALSPNGRILSVVRDANVVQVEMQTLYTTKLVELFDTESGARLASILPIRDHEPGSAHFSPRGDILAVTTPSGIELWDLVTFAQVGVLPVTGVARALTFSPDGATVHAGAQRFDALTGLARDNLPEPDSGHASAISGLAYGPSGQLVVWRRGSQIEVDIYVQ